MQIEFAICLYERKSKLVVESKSFSISLSINVTGDHFGYSSIGPLKKIIKGAIFYYVQEKHTFI